MPILDRSSCTVIGRTRHVTVQSEAILTGLPIRKCVLLVGLSFADFETDKTVHLILYLTLSGRSKHQLQKSIWIYWLIKIDPWISKVNVSGSAKWMHCAGSIFSMKLSRFMGKAIKLLLTELVDQCRNILPLALSALVSLRSVSPEQDAGNIFLYCLTAYLYAKCWNLIGWIMEHGPSIHFRIDGPDRLYGFRPKLKKRIFGKMVENLSTEDYES